MTDYPVLVALVLLSLALLISLCLNVIFCIRQRATLCRDKGGCCLTHTYTGESPSQDEGQYFPNLNHHEQQENPIYGNISSDRRDSVEVCYEIMTLQHTRDRMKSLEPDLNYASLDLKMAKKRMNIRHQQGHDQGRNKLQDELPAHLTPPLNAFLEVEADMDAHLPSRDTSIMVSQSSIYLNSQQIVLEAEEMARERGIKVERDNVGWEGRRRRDDRQSREWKVKQECEEREDRRGSVGSACTQLSEVEAILSGTDCFLSNFSHDNDQD